MPDLHQLREQIAGLECQVNSRDHYGWVKCKAAALAIIDAAIGEEREELDLRQTRLACGYGLRQFAERIGFLPSQYCDIEQGRREPTEREKQQICCGLGCIDFPPIPAPRDDGPVIPVFVKTVDGKPLSDERARQLYDDLNRPRMLATLTDRVTESMPGEGE
jgi:transcriptional regulator with XRE-family HTH domain